MAKICTDLLVIETSARLFGTSAFLDAVDEAIPTLEAKEHSYLEQRAAREGWEPSEYSMEKDLLDWKFRTWVPTFAAYSVVILLYSIVETQLCAFAEHLGKKRGSELHVKHMAGRGIDQSALYLERVLSLPVKTDPDWSRLQDLQLLRNIIVHRGGKPGDSSEQRGTVQELIRKCPRKLQLKKADGIHEQMWISMNLCRDFAKTIESFFERIFKSAGLPNRHMQLDG